MSLDKPCCFVCIREISCLMSCASRAIEARVAGDLGLHSLTEAHDRKLIDIGIGVGFRTIGSFNVKRFRDNETLWK